MTIIDDRGDPVPDGHPLKGLPDIPGAKRPGSPPGAPPQQPAPPAERGPAQSKEQKSQA